MPDIHGDSTPSEWEQWFADVVQESTRWSDYAQHPEPDVSQDTAATNLETGRVEPTVSRTLGHMRGIQNHKYDIAGAFESPAPSARIFSHMSPQSRIAFFDGWNRVAAT